ncbi:V-type ATP synthase subunit I [Natronomonas sp. F2-12]|jgi:V/A-type H+-transporting ATPase subunit I|uniref:A-type ATP synthase subunit I n=1 Tax=Natronomonas aquatica TaxID=2841590 RepID=A0A9R1CU61_9EURY|nr:V-type ATP synthase subunit I [Natronomonas aquatica]MCQ4333965.1 V-type ATP synthase subunit I [Natronomonas aquatica]
MLRPERMSRVSVTGSKRVMDDAIEAIHDLNQLHVTEYDDTWEGFDPGDPVEGAEEAAQKLVTVRALQSTLDVTEEDAGRARIIGDEELEAELEETRKHVNELDDRRSDLADELREIDDKVDTARPFAELGIDLDLFSGYDSLTAAVGEGDADAIRGALADAEAVEEYELFEAGDFLALFVYPDVDVQDALVGVSFTEYEVPDLDEEGGATSPEDYIEDLQHRRRRIESELETVENELEDLRHEVAGFLLAAEEKLSIEVQKLEAPLTFATTENAFVAEGWIPTEQVTEMEATLESAVGDHVELEELERASYDEDGHAHEREPVESGEGETVATDGGTEMSGGSPPVVQSNPGPVKPFETLVGVINRPNYNELDPTVILFLTFPAFFGFMIGDLGYGLLYIAFGFLLMRRFESDAIRSLGGVGVAAGVFTAVFGVLYGEFFGLHQLGEIVWGGNPPIHKGLTPTHADYALGWLVVSLLVGVVHLAIGWIIDFYQNLSHGLVDAVLESGSWLLMMFGLWAWIFADAPPTGAAPGLLVGAESGVFAGHPFAFGFTGFDPVIGLVGLAAFALGFVLLVLGEPMEGVEFLNVLVNVLSYTRITAVLLAKAGMAFVVNLLVFGVYVTEETHGGETVDAWHFGLGGMPESAGTTFHGYEVVEIMSPGLVHGSVAAIVGGVLVLVIGHLIVLALGITSAGLQGVRLEYVEFFGKFYEGGGEKYEPFGRERTYTTED